MKRHADNLLAAVRAGLSGTSRKLSRPPRTVKKRSEDPDFGMRLHKLHEWRKDTAVKQGVRADVVLPKTSMYLIAKRNPANSLELELIMKGTPYRYEKYGDEILQTLKRSDSLTGDVKQK